MKRFFLLMSAACAALTAVAQNPGPKSGWLHDDLQRDSVYGISSAKAYEFLKGRKSVPVIVAVIDSGIDTAHADLRSVLWANRKEKRANGKDDDRNRYKDDFNGWSFLGSAKGNVNQDNLELTRLVRELRKKYSDSAARLTDSAGYSKYLAIYGDYQSKLVQANLAFRSANTLKMVIDSMLTGIGTQNPTLAQWNAYEPKSMQEANIKAFVRTRLQIRQLEFAAYKREEVDEPVAQARRQLDISLNPDFDPRQLVGDSYADTTERYYGIGDVTGPNAAHGTHVAGIIGAVRNNGIGIDGIADNVRIMAVRAVPDGDERDKDVANAIRYAVDNGASIINMSFGKPYSPHKTLVDEAVKYAMEKNVLIVHAAGNDMLNLDIRNNFPNKRYADGSGVANAWLEVGASQPQMGKLSLAAGFSNYGQTTVDLFAPGTQIYSTMPASTYEYMDGTSMAAPVVTGIAALIRSYFPALTAAQVKEILMQTVTRVDAPAMLLLENKQVHFSNLSISGGIVNACEAVKLAASIAEGGALQPTANVQATAKATAKTNIRQAASLGDITAIGAPGSTPAIAATAVVPARDAATLNISATKAGSAEEWLKMHEYNEEAPDFTLKDLDGNMVTMSALRGKVVILDFWATWCVPCVRSFPAMQLAQNKYKDDPQVKFLFLHTMNRVDTAEIMAKRLMSKYNYSFQVLMDLVDKSTGRSPVSKAYRVIGLPAKMIVDPKGIIRYKSDGFNAVDATAAADELSTMIEAARKVR